MTSRTSSTPWPIWFSPRASTRRRKALPTAWPPSSRCRATSIAPPDPDVVRTPARGLRADLPRRVGVRSGGRRRGRRSPRVKAQPALNAWLATALPPLNTIACRAVWTPAGGAEQSTLVTLADLQLAPIDVLYILSDEGGSGLSELDDRVRRHVVAAAAPRDLTPSSASATWTPPPVRSASSRPPRS